jgi:ribosome biogenesis GTPase
MTIKLAKIIRSARREFSLLELNPDHSFIRPFQTLEAKALGLLLKEGDLVPGDTVEVEFRQNEWIITRLLPRRNQIFRNLQRENKKKILASNIDYLVLVFSVERPEFKRGLLDRYLLRSAQWEIPSIIVFNKCDYFPGGATLSTNEWDFELQRVKDLCKEVYCISATNPNMLSPLSHCKNFHELQENLKNQTVIFLGQSGVGKSKLIQSLSNEKVLTKSLDLGVVGKGVHTTTWTELHVLEQFNLMDSPGIRSLSLSDITQDELLFLMPDLEEYSRKCKFHNCQHEEKSKGCIFWSGQINESIKSRFESYQRFKEEIHSGKEWEKEEF